MSGRRGAPDGNQNARKHGFYSGRLTEKQQRDFETATGVDGLDEEIALLRVKIKSVVECDPENVRLIMQAINSLARLIVAKYDIGREDKKGIREGIITVLRDIALPIGVGISSRLGGWVK